MKYICKKRFNRYEVGQEVTAQQSKMIQLLNVGLVEAVDEQVTETKIEQVAEVKDGDNSTEPTRNKRKPKTVSK